MNLSVAGGQQLLQPQSSAVAAPARVARAASAPRLLASSTRLGTRATSAPRRAQVAVAGVDDEDEEGVTIDDGDGDGGEEVLLAMGNAINRWGRDKNSGIGRGAASRTGSVTAAGDGSADVPLPSSVMAKMGLLPDSMLQRAPTVRCFALPLLTICFAPHFAPQNNRKLPLRPFPLLRRPSSTLSTALPHYPFEPCPQHMMRSMLAHPCLRRLGRAVAGLFPVKRCRADDRRLGMLLKLMIIETLLVALTYWMNTTNSALTCMQ